MANVPVYNADNISIGPGILYVGLSGTTPTQDVGAIAEDGMQLTTTRDYLEIHQGSPKVLIKQFVTGETVQLTCQTIEWNVTNLVLALGAGVTTSTSLKDTFSFGADPNTKEIAVHVQHAMPSGHTISVYVWKAQPSGEWSLSMKQDEIQQFPFSFKALQAATDWGGSALPVGQQLFRVVRFKV